MKMQEKIVVLFANPYDMKDEQGRTLQGVSVSYLYGGELKPMMNVNGSIGQRPAKGSLIMERWDKFVDAPGMYEGSFEMAIGGDGKPALKLVDVDYIGAVSLVSNARVSGEKVGAGK